MTTQPIRPKWIPGQVMSHAETFDIATSSNTFVPKLDIPLPGREVLILGVGLSIERLEGSSMMRVRVRQGGQEMEWQVQPIDAHDYNVEVRARGENVAIDLVSFTEDARVVGTVAVLFEAPEPSAVDRLAQIANPDEQA